jgi:hypothetical protein
MIIINTSQYNGLQKGVNVFFAREIMWGNYIGKYATSDNALNEFAEVFSQITYEQIDDLDSSYFGKNYTAPTLLPYAVEIPEIYQWAFPEDKFILDGFIIPLDTYTTLKVVNLAYFEWAEFRAELDSGNYEALKRSLMNLWDYVAEQVTNNNIIVL